jgi:hypothetical protein
MFYGFSHPKEEMSLKGFVCLRNAERSGVEEAFCLPHRSGQGEVIPKLFTMGCEQVFSLFFELS